MNWLRLDLDISKLSRCLKFHSPPPPAVIKLKTLCTFCLPGFSIYPFSCYSFLVSFIFISSLFFPFTHPKNFDLSSFSGDEDQEFATAMKNKLDGRGGGLLTWCFTSSRLSTAPRSLLLWPLCFFFTHLHSLYLIT